MSEIDDLSAEAALWKARVNRARQLMRGWQPIETYPNDGTPVLGYSSRLASVGLRNYSGQMVITRTGPGPEGVESWFTHWMPLPDPPKETL